MQKTYKTGLKNDKIDQLINNTMTSQ